MRPLTLNTALALSLAATPLLAQDKPGEGVTVRPVASLIAEELSQSRIIDRALSALGCAIEPQQVEIQTAHLAMGTGVADFYTAHWHLLHAAFLAKSGGGEVLQRLAPSSTAWCRVLGRQGVLRRGCHEPRRPHEPAIAANFDGDGDGDGKADLAGYVPGWGCERIIKHHMDEYGPRDTATHNLGKYNALMADTIA